MSGGNSLELSGALLPQATLIGIQPDLAEPKVDQSARLVDIDFSLAIHNRTGKYFIGAELLAMEGLPRGDTYYWHRAADVPPSGLRGRIVGRLQHWHVMAHSKGGLMRLLPRRRAARPLLHLDPFTVPTAVLRRHDGVLIHDLGPLTHPELFPADVVDAYRPIYEEIARVGPNLVFVSRSVQSEFVARFPSSRPASRTVVHPPIRSAAREGDETPVAGVAAPFLLTVGSVGHRKNQARCIAAYARSGLAGRGVSYVIAGGPEPGHADVVRAAAETPGVVLLPYVSDAELRWLYAHARGFVLLSLLEGFGMPVAEAIGRGLVPLVSRGSVLQEVAGDAALTADPKDEGEMAQAMIALFEMPDEARSARLVRLGNALRRFDIDLFHDGWRDVFFKMLTTL